MLRSLLKQPDVCARIYCTVNTVCHSCCHHHEFTSRRTHELRCCNWPNSQIPECTCSISHNATFSTEMCTFVFWMLHCGIWNRCILGFVRSVYCGFGMTSQLLPLTLSERTSHRPSSNAIWDLRHDLRRDLTESRRFSFVNTTWLGPGPSLKWDSVQVQAKSWVKSQVKTVSEYGIWCWPSYMRHFKT